MSLTIVSIIGSKRVRFWLYSIFILCCVCAAIIYKFDGILIAGEPSQSVLPKIIIENLYDQIKDGRIIDFNDSSNIPRALDHNPISAIVNYSILYIASFIFGINSFGGALIFGVMLNYLAFLLLLKTIDSKLNQPLFTSLIFLLMISNYQSVELISGGGIAFFNSGILLVWCACFLSVLNKNNKIYNDILFIIASVLIIYGPIYWLFIPYVAIISAVFFLGLKDTCTLIKRNLILIIICSLLISPRIYLIYVNKGNEQYFFNLTEFIFLFTGGMVKLSSFPGRSPLLFIYGYLVFFCYIFIYYQWYFFEKKNYYTKKGVQFVGVIIICGTTALGSLLFYILPLFNNFRSAYKLSFLLNFAAITFLVVLIDQPKRLLLLKLTITCIVSYSLILMSVHHSILNIVPLDRNKIASIKYINDNFVGNKILLPLSFRGENYTSAYKNEAKTPYFSEYVSGSFDYLYPLKGLIPLDQIDNLSSERKWALQFTHLDSESIFNDFIVANCVKYIILDKKKNVVSSNTNIMQMLRRQRYIYEDENLAVIPRNDDCVGNGVIADTDKFNKRAEFYNVIKTQGLAMQYPVDPKAQAFFSTYSAHDRDVFRVKMLPNIKLCIPKDIMSNVLLFHKTSCSIRTNSHFNDLELPMTPNNTSFESTKSFHDDSIIQFVSQRFSLVDDTQGEICLGGSKKEQSEGCNDIYLIPQYR